MSSNASAEQSGKRPSGTRRTASRVCVLCRRALAQDDVAIEIQGVSAHVGCAAYRRRSARR
jgi:hypothetical protein